MTNSKLSGTKPAITSVGILGGLFSGAAGLWQILQHAMDSGALPPSVTPYIAAIGGVVAIFGRWNAQTKIKGVVNADS